MELISLSSGYDLTQIMSEVKVEDAVLNVDVIDTNTLHLEELFDIYPLYDHDVLLDHIIETSLGDTYALENLLTYLEEADIADDSVIEVFADAYTDWFDKHAKTLSGALSSLDPSDPSFYFIGSVITRRDAGNGQVIILYVSSKDAEV